MVLGLLSSARAVPLAVVYALLLAPGRRWLLTAYVGAGLVLSLGVGAAVVAWFGAPSGSAEAGTDRLVIDLVLGATALVAAVVLRHPRFHSPAGTRGRRRVAPGSALRSALGERLRSPTMTSAGLAGAVTNLPGVFYIAGLVAILETHPTHAGGLLQVVVYNILRFAVPVLALVSVFLRPDRTAVAMRTAQDWGIRHRRNLITVVLGAVGVYLVVKALLGLWS